MKIKIRILSTLIALTLLFAVFSVTVSATGEVETPTTEPLPVETTAPDPGTDVTPTTEPDNSGGTTTDPGVGEGGEGSGTTDPTTPEDGGTTVEPTTDNDYNDSYTNEDGSYYFDEDEMVNNVDGVASNVTDQTNLYDTSNFSESALKETKWNDIALNISAGNTSDAMDFSAIKDNKSTDDNGQWMIYTGYVLIAASVLGIMYFIIATATYKNRLKKLKAREQKQRYREHREQRARDDYGDYMSEYPTQRDYNQRYQRRYTTDNRSYSERKRSRQDTAEIDIPARYRARH